MTMILNGLKTETIRKCINNREQKPATNDKLKQKMHFNK